MFFIRGQVAHPGLYILRSDLTISQAIAMAGGRTERASDQVDIMRTIDGQSATLSVDWTASVEPDDTLVARRRLF